MKNKKDIYVITGVVACIDQIVKIIISHTLDLYEQIKIIPHFFSLLYVENTGAAFSILENNMIFIILLSVFFIVIIHDSIRKEDNFNTLSILGFGLLLGGIYGNLIDRIIHRGVIDYLAFNIFGYNFPIFNIADIGITVGVFLLALYMIFNRGREE